MGRTLHGGRADGARRPLNLSRSPIEFMAKAVPGVVQTLQTAFTRTIAIERRATSTTG
jgi:hypothetical protein